MKIHRSLVLSLCFSLQAPLAAAENWDVQARRCLTLLDQSRDNAEQVCRQALGRAEKTGIADELLANVMNRLGVFCDEKGRVDDAERM